MFDQIAGIAKGVGDRARESGLIFHDEHRRASDRRRLRRTAFADDGRRRQLASADGQLDVERRAGAGPRLEPDPAAVLLHDRVGDGQPRPVPLPTSFVVKNGSKIFGCRSSGMPGPSSLISRITDS